MLVNNNGSSAMAIPVTVRFPNDPNVKMAVYANDAQRLALALIRGDEQGSSGLLSYTNPTGLPYTQGSMLGKVHVDAQSSMDIDVVEGKNKSTRNVPTLDRGHVLVTVGALLVKLYADKYLINHEANARGVGLSSVMRARVAEIQTRIQRIEDLTCLAANLGEQLAYVDNSALYVTGIAPVVLGLSGYSAVRANTTPLLSTLAEVKVAAKSEMLAAIEGLTSAQYDSKIANNGIEGWLTGDSWVAKIDRATPLAWVPDRYTRRMAADQGASFYHLNRFIKRYFKGSSVVATQIGSGSFAKAADLTGKSGEIVDVPDSLAAYLLAIDVDHESITDMVGHLAAIDLYQMGSIEPEATAKTEEGNALSQLVDIYPGLWPVYENFHHSAEGAVDSANLTMNISSTSDRQYDGVARLIGSLTDRDRVALIELTTHMSFVLGLFHHATHVGQVKSLLTSSIRLKDSVGCLRAMGLEWLMYQGGHYNVRQYS